MIRGVPYDHQLEYIEIASTGTFRVPTGLVLPTSGVFEIRVDAYVPTEARTHNTFVSRYTSGGYGFVFSVRSGKPDLWLAGSYSLPNTVYGERHLFTLSGDGTETWTLACDGATRTINRGSNWDKGTKTISLFNPSDRFNEQAAPGDRIYSIKFIFDGEVVRDFIPVKALGVARLYDRKTGTFLVNEGTGAFVAGPVASTPLMGVHMYPQVYTPADYVQDGLLAGWSGIAQGGIPNVWKDFSGHKYDLTINPNTSHFESNYLDVGSISTAGAYSEGVLIPGVKHMEICCYVSQKTSNALLFYNGSVPSNMILTSHSTAGVQTSNTKRHTAYVRTTGYYMLSATADVLYANGERVVDTTFSTDSWSGGSNSLCLFGRLTDTAYGTAGRIYSARAYSRELTPEEVAHNYEVDKSTFDLPNPE